MLHLFNKVFLKPDAQFARSKHSIIVSSKVDFLTPQTADVDAIEFGTVYFAARTYDELLSNYFNNDEDQLFQWLLNFDKNLRFTFYCDDETFNHLTFKWLKTILINADPDTAFKVARLTYLRYAYLWGYSYLPYIRVTEAQAAQLRNTGHNVLTREQFQPLWEQATRFNVDFETIAPIASVEYQLASYIVDNKWEHADIVRNKLVTMVKKLHVRKMIDGKHGILQGLYTQPDFDIFNQSLVEYVTAHPEFTPLIDSNVLPDKYEYVYSTYITPQFVDKFIGRYKEIAGNPTEEGLPAAKFLDGNVTADEIIEIEKQSPLIRVNLGLWEYYETVNIYLLHYIFKLYSNNNLTELKKISLLKE